MEKEFNLFPILSLKEMILRRMAVNFWSDPFILLSMHRINKSIMDTCYIPKCKLWRTIIDRIKRHISKFEFPALVKERLMYIVRSVGQEVLRWKLYHDEVLNPKHDYLVRHILEQLCWTHVVALDYQKTAKALVRSRVLDVDKRYRLACLYCFEDCIPALWANLPEVYKKRFNNLEFPLPENVFHLEYYWASVLKREELNLSDILPAEFVNESSTYLSYFNHSVCKGSKAATEYFFQKLTDDEQVNAPCRTLCDALGRDKRSYMLADENEKPTSDVFAYMLSLMTHEQQLQVFKEHPFSSLAFFLDWPWQELCLNITDIIWKLLPESQFHLVYERLHRIVFSTGYYAPYLFQTFFLHSPYAFKKHFVEQECLNGFEFCLSFALGVGAESIKVVLRNLDAGDKMRLLSDRSFYCCVCFLMNKNKHSLVELCVGETMLSKEEREILKTVYGGFYRHYEGRNYSPYQRPHYGKLDQSRFSQLLEMLDGTINNKRSLGYEAVARAWRLSCEEEKYDLFFKRLKRH